MLDLTDIKEGLKELDVDFVEAAPGNIKALVAEVERLRAFIAEVMSISEQQALWLRDMDAPYGQIEIPEEIAAKCKTALK